MYAAYTWEHNGSDTLIYFDDFPGAYVRGQSREAALEKADSELRAYLLWRDGIVPTEDFTYILRQDYTAPLQVCDADSDVLLESEKLPLTEAEYISLKSLALRSAACFAALYHAIPDKAVSLRHRRQTFYGQIPASAEEMYRHTKNVNAYYFDQLGIETDNEPDILSCRERGFELLEQKPEFLQNPILEGDYNELWSLRKLLRRFLWHDRIHAKAMYRQAICIFNPDIIANPFCF